MSAIGNSSTNLEEQVISIKTVLLDTLRTLLKPQKDLLRLLRIFVLFLMYSFFIALPAESSSYFFLFQAALFFICVETMTFALILDKSSNNYFRFWERPELIGYQIKVKTILSSLYASLIVLWSLFLFNYSHFSGFQKSDLNDTVLSNLDKNFFVSAAVLALFSAYGINLFLFSEFYKILFKKDGVGHIDPNFHITKHKMYITAISELTVYFFLVTFPTLVFEALFTGEIKNDFLFQRKLILFIPAVIVFEVLPVFYMFRYVATGGIKKDY